MPIDPSRLGEAYSLLYPDAVFEYEVRDDSDGNGPYLHHFDEDALGPRPTDEQLQAVLDEADAAAIVLEANRDRLAELKVKAITDTLNNDEANEMARLLVKLGII